MGDMIDTWSDNAPCNIIERGEGWANVVYHDEPDTIVMCGDMPGRFKQLIEDALAVV